MQELQRIQNLATRFISNTRLSDFRTSESLRNRINLDLVYLNKPATPGKILRTPSRNSTPNFRHTTPDKPLRTIPKQQTFSRTTHSTPNLHIIGYRYIPPGTFHPGIFYQGLFPLDVVPVCSSLRSR